MSTNIYSASSRYPLSSLALHWLTAVLLVLVYGLIEFRDIYPKGSDGRELMKQWHFMLGLTVFALTLVRLALRTQFTPPPILPAPPDWQQWLAKAMHSALYLLLIVLPVLGWATLSAKGKPIPFFGLELPSLFSADKSLAQQLEGWHELIGTTGLYLIGLHTLAALVHHYFMRDNTLNRMAR